MALFVEGFASTSAIDLDDHSFEPDAIRWPNFNGLSPPIELLWHHQPAQPAGKIITLERRATKDGSLGLWCRASVDPAYEKKAFTGFSVRTKVQSYSIKTIPKPHAVVTSAVLLEVSLVQKPCNLDCIIVAREELPEITPFLISSINKVRTLQLMIEQLQRAKP